jgi:hypothetical protein
LHQKAEIARIDILATRDNEVLAAVTGQIIRSGIFQDQAFTEAFPLTLRRKLSVRMTAGTLSSSKWQRTVSATGCNEGSHHRER